MKNLYLLICSLFLFAFSCEREEINCSGETTSISFELLQQNSDSGCHIQNIKESTEVGSQENLIIQSQADYEKYILCHSSLPTIDFSKKTLLAGRYVAANMDWIDNQQVYQNCDGKVVFKVKLERGGYTAITKVYYFVVIPKISNATQVNFDIGY